jgi:uncharacterized protein YecE (DUF72 family)
MPLVIGTSGWQYRDWRGYFYPRPVPQRAWLEFYGERFRTVEVNNSFYMLPKPATFADWAARTPPDFVVGAKVSRYLTHYKRLREPAEPVARFLTSVRELGGKLGPVLLQLPPRFAADPAALDETLGEFPRDVRVAVEPRDPSWWTDDVRTVLTKHGAALSWADRNGRPTTELWRTAGWGYLRFHEGCAHDRPSYGRRALLSWLDRIEREFGSDDDVYVYFNNDPTGAALRDAVRFSWLAERRGWPVTRVPQRDEVGLTPRLW